MNYLLLFLAVVFGLVVAQVFRKRGLQHMPLFLAFSGAFLLSITLFELLPNVFSTSGEETGLFIMLGILLQIVLDFFSKGAEHGHLHLHDERKAFPWLLFASLAIHALIEGFPVADSSSMLIGVLVHKVPIAIILALFFLNSGYSKLVTLSFLFFFALMTPLGSYLSEELEMVQPYLVKINAIAIGIFLHVSTTILFESSKDHKFNLAKLISIILGIGIAYFV